MLRSMASLNEKIVIVSNFIFTLNVVEVITCHRSHAGYVIVLYLNICSIRRYANSDFCYRNYWRI